MCSNVKVCKGNPWVVSSKRYNQGRIQKIQKEGAEKKNWRERNIAPQHTTHEHPRGDCRIPLERWFASKFVYKNLRERGGGGERERYIAVFKSAHKYSYVAF